MKMNRLLFLFIIIESGLLCLGILLLGFLWVVVFFPPQESQKEEKLIRIEKGENVFSIGRHLEEEGIIDRGWFFVAYAFVQGRHDDLKAGTYRLNPTMSIKEILQKIISGEVEVRRITIREGWNVRDIGRYLEAEGLFGEAEFSEFVGIPATDYGNRNDNIQPKDFSSQFPFLRDKSTRVGLEGYLFPDSYELPYDVALEELIEQMLHNFDKKITENLREEIKRQGKSLFEIVTMASLIEKEVRTPEDRRIVSGILWKRRNAGIPLQVDATINYITGKQTTKISNEETKIDSPYNTYRYRGLPLGPIANPGLDSIFAAIFPQESSYWFYLSTPEGKTIFSRTLEEHNIAKRKYLR